MATVEQDVVAARTKLQDDLAVLKSKYEADVAAGAAAIKAKEGELEKLEEHASAVSAWFTQEWDALKAFFTFHKAVTTPATATPVPAAPASNQPDGGLK